MYLEAFYFFLRNIILSLKFCRLFGCIHSTFYIHFLQLRLISLSIYGGLSLQISSLFNYRLFRFHFLALVSSLGIHMPAPFSPQYIILQSSIKIQNQVTAGLNNTRAISASFILMKEAEIARV